MSRDVKSVTLDGINTGLENAIAKSERRLRDNIQHAETEAIIKANSESRRLVNNAKYEINQRLQVSHNQLRDKIDKAQRELGAHINDVARTASRALEALDERHTKMLNDTTDAIYGKIDENHELLQEEISRLSSDLRSNVNRIDSNVNRLNSSLNSNIRRIDSNIGVLTRNINGLADGLSKLSHDVDRRFDEQDRQIASLQADVKMLYNRQEADLNNKLLAAGQALALLELVRERTDIKRFAPKDIQDRVNLLEANLRNIKQTPDMFTVSEANILIAETIVMENAAVREQMKWEAQYDAALTAANALLLMMQESMQLKVTSLYDEAQEEELQTDYWTQGRYGQLYEQIKMVKKQIENRSMSIEELKLAQEQIAIMEREGEQLRVEASQRGVLSETRVIVSNDILNTMVEQGWELKEEPGYMGGDEEEDCRQGTFAIIQRQATGEEISVLVLPDEDGGKLANKIIFHRNDTKEEGRGAFQARMEVIRREIEKSGYKLGPLGEPQCGGDNKIEQLQSGRQMRKKGASKQLEERLKAVK